jgi:hypothetical protein
VSVTPVVPPLLLSSVMVTDGDYQLKAATTPTIVDLNCLSQVIYAAVDQLLPAHEWGSRPHMLVSTTKE